MPLLADQAANNNEMENDYDTNKEDEDSTPTKKTSVLKKRLSKTMSKVKKISTKGPIRFSRKSSDQDVYKMEMLNSCSSLNFDAEQDDLDMMNYNLQQDLSSGCDDTFDCIHEEDEEEEQRNKSRFETERVQADDGKVGGVKQNGEEDDDDQCTESTSPLSTSVGTANGSLRSNLHSIDEDNDDDEKNCARLHNHLRNDGHDDVKALRAPSMMQLSSRQKKDSSIATSDRTTNSSPSEQTGNAGDTTKSKGISSEEPQPQTTAAAQEGNGDDVTTTAGNSKKGGRSVLKTTAKKAFKAIGKVTSPKFNSSKKSTQQQDATSETEQFEEEVGEEEESDPNNTNNEDGQQAAVDEGEEVCCTDNEEYIEKATKEASEIGEESNVSKNHDSPSAGNRRGRGEANGEKKRRNHTKTSSKRQRPVAVMGWYRKPRDSKSSQGKDTEEKSESVSQSKSEQIDTSSSNPNLKSSMSQQNASDESTNVVAETAEQSSPIITSNVDDEALKKVDHQLTSPGDGGNVNRPSPMTRKSSSHRNSSTPSAQKSKSASSQMKSLRGKNRKRQSEKRGNTSNSKTTKVSEHEKSVSVNDMSGESPVEIQKISIGRNDSKHVPVKGDRKSNERISSNIEPRGEGLCVESINTIVRTESLRESGGGNEQNLKRCSELFADGESNMGGYFAKIQQRDSAGEKVVESAEQSGADNREGGKDSKSNGQRIFKTPRGLKKLFKGSKSSPKSAESPEDKRKRSSSVSPHPGNGEDNAAAKVLMEELSSILSPSLKSETMRHTRTIKCNDSNARPSSNRSLKAETMRNSRSVTLDDSPTQYFPDIPTEKKTRLSDIRRLVQESRSDGYQVPFVDGSRGQLSRKHSRHERRRSTGIPERKEIPDGSPTSIAPGPPDVDGANGHSLTPTQLRRRRVSRSSSVEGDDAAGETNGDSADRSTWLSEHPEKTLRPEERRSIASTQRKSRHRAPSQKSPKVLATADSLASSERHRRRARQSSPGEEQGGSKADSEAKIDVPLAQAADVKPATTEKRPGGRKVNPSNSRRGDGRHGSHQTIGSSDKRPHSKPTEIVIDDSVGAERKADKESAFQTKHRSRYSRSASGASKELRSSKDIDSTNDVSHIDTACHENHVAEEITEKGSEEPQLDKNAVRSKMTSYGDTESQLSTTTGSIPFARKRSGKPSHRRGPSKSYGKDVEPCRRRKYERSASAGNVSKPGKPVSEFETSRPSSARLIRMDSYKESLPNHKVEKTLSASTEKAESRQIDQTFVLETETEKSELPGSKASSVVRSKSRSEPGPRDKIRHSGDKAGRNEGRGLEKQAVMTIPEEKELEGTIARPPSSLKGPSLAESLETGALSNAPSLFDDGQYSVSTDGGGSAIFVDGKICYSNIKSSRSVCAPQLVFGSKGEVGNLEVQNAE